MCCLTVAGEAGGRDEAFAQGLFSLVGYGPVISKDSALQLIQVGGGKLHASPGAVPILIIAPLQHRHTCKRNAVVSFLLAAANALPFRDPSVRLKRPCPISD